MVIDNSRRDTRGRASGINGEELLETVLDTRFEGAAGERIDVTKNVRVAPSQDYAGSNADQGNRTKDLGHSRFLIPCGELFRANEDSASVRVLL